jgi:hypothetical protein
MRTRLRLLRRSKMRNAELHRKSGFLLAFAFVSRFNPQLNDINSKLNVLIKSWQKH